MRIVGLLGLLLVGCAEPGFMLTRPHFAALDVPISVCPSDYVLGRADEGARKMTAWAIGTSNERLGFALFKMMDAAQTDCDVTVVIGTPVDVGPAFDVQTHADDAARAGGDARFDPATLTGTRCAITTSNTGSDEILGYVLEHELGHCAGLDHDDWDGSIMRRVQRRTEDAEWPPWIDDWDRALLRRTYRP